MSEKDNLPDVFRGPLVPIESVTQLPDWWTKVAGNSLFISSINPKAGAKEKRRLMRHLQSGQETSELHINTVMEIVDRTFFPVRKETEEGEVVEFPGCVLELKDGTLVRFGSRGIVKSLFLIETLDRPAPWNPPLKVKLTSSTLANGKRWFELTLADDEDDKTSSGGRKK